MAHQNIWYNKKVHRHKMVGHNLQNLLKSNMYAQKVMEHMYLLSCTFYYTLQVLEDHLEKSPSLGVVVYIFYETKQFSPIIH